MSTKHHTYAKIVRGPGGFKCRCCAVFRPAKAKRVNARALRRATKQALRCVSVEAS